MIWPLFSVSVVLLLVATGARLRRRGRFARLPTFRVADERRPEGTRQTVEFPACDGTRLEGWLFMPNGYRPPLVIMAPGLTSTKDSHLEPFAWRFVQQGFAVLLFDYRCFGGSDGEPRHWVDLGRHREDYRAAIAYARRELPRRVDTRRLALWGSSFSGGTALLTAAEEPELRAVVVQAPYLETPKSLQPSLLDMIRYVFLTMLDLSGLFPPIYVPVFGRRGEWAFCKSAENPRRDQPDDPTASVFFRTLPKPLRGGWENKMLARMLATLDEHKPMDAVAKVACPVLLVAAEKDDLVPVDVVARAAAQGKELVTFPCTHFELYVGPCLGPNVDAQAQFLAERL